MRPLILDFDASVRALTDADVIDCRAWEERIRFGCGMGHWRTLAAHLDATIPARHGTVLMGSGDFHHLSTLLLARQPAAEPLDVLVFDNHPDNMRFPFGIHCGSWVRHAARLPNVGRIDVVGITSGDVGLRHAWENYLRPLYAGRIAYWTLGVDTRWASRVGLGRQFRSFADPAALIDALLTQLRSRSAPCYLSIDKDVLSPEEARTNWDQGRLRVEHMLPVIDALRGRLVGSDITGEVSVTHYTTAWKRWLAALDAQPAIAPDMLSAWQAQQAAVNARLLAAISTAH